MTLTRFLSRYLKIPVVPNAAVPDFQLAEMMERLHTHTAAPKMAPKSRVRRPSQQGTPVLPKTGVPG